MAGDNATLVISIASAEGARSSVILQVLVSVPAYQLSVQPASVQVCLLGALLSVYRCKQASALCVLLCGVTVWLCGAVNMTRRTI